ncbi:hypothetical protein BABINDRAFT_129462 [Babjeviella inositovora NRRL Y-12698]|uniref:2-dehydropantoate 2-reductase n=1 Tax=Babjeviella inositovora NRRL Y-12698 TaxID=984486 RepID=A0A1E3QT27_9ASCO|nr:uncharacterized protein BABINDRAFT_129462 [Babjeviella inositovora NRRL Y-12698]ODQ80172.1 hypothetical protein BABINDRAFT_129462 [Babjeviella inositovora NRRL Y-12698]
MSAPVYHLGAGAIGCLVAHSLASLVPKAPPVTLLLRTQEQLNNLLSNQNRVIVTKDYHQARPTSAVQVQGLDAARGVALRDIETLVVTTKVHQTAEALKPYLKCLTPASDVIFIQNGMGLADELAVLWDARARPRLYQGVISHGAVRSSDYDFHIHHMGNGSLTISAIPDSMEGFRYNQHNTTSDKPRLVEMLQNGRGLEKTNELNVTYTTPYELMLLQMEKLVANACINPLTALYDCYNGELLQVAQVSGMFSEIIRECVRVLYKEYRFLEQDPAASVRLGHERLLSFVVDICQKTAKNSSSMRQDLVHLRESEIDYINGYVVRLARKHNVHVPHNAMMVRMVRGRLSLNRYRANDAIKMVL